MLPPPPRCPTKPPTASSAVPDLRGVDLYSFVRDSRGRRVFFGLPALSAAPPTTLSPAPPYPIAPPSSAIPTAPAASEHLHPDTPSTFRSPPAWLSPSHEDSACLRQTALVPRLRFAARVVTPAAPLLSPRPSRALVASFAGRPRSLPFSCCLG